MPRSSEFEKFIRDLLKNPETEFPPLEWKEVEPFVEQSFAPRRRITLSPASIKTISIGIGILVIIIIATWGIVKWVSSSASEEKHIIEGGKNFSFPPSEYTRTMNMDTANAGHISLSADSVRTDTVTIFSNQKLPESKTTTVLPTLSATLQPIPTPTAVMEENVAKEKKKQDKTVVSNTQKQPKDSIPPSASSNLDTNSAKQSSSGDVVPSPQQQNETEQWRDTLRTLPQQDTAGKQKSEKRKVRIGRNY